MDAAQWPQDIGGVVRPILDHNQTSKPIEKKPRSRPQKEQALNCPRCKSTNTKFCYYNNYSLSQPRHFCKACTRYWTEGGTLRNVPLGGISRRNKRSSNHIIPSAISSSKNVLLTDVSLPKISPQNPNKIHDQGQDLSSPYHTPSLYSGIMSEFVALPFIKNNLNGPQNPNCIRSSNYSHLPFMELLRTGNNNVISSGGQMSNYDLVSMPFSDPNISSFQMHQELKPSLIFSSGDNVLDQKGYSGDLQGDEEDHHTKHLPSRTIFPFHEEVKPVPGTGEFGQDRGQGDCKGYDWNEMLW